MKTTSTLAALAMGAAVAATSAKAEDYVIGLSNSYFGNTWRHIMVDAFEEAASQAKADGRIADFVTLNGDGSVNTQVAQFNDLILRGVDAILVVAASETVLNGCGRASSTPAGRLSCQGIGGGTGSFR